MFARLRLYLRRRKYAVGARLSEFLAPDVRREVEIVDASELEQGYVTARMRTWNVLYAIRGLQAAPPLEPPRRVAIAELWKWTGEPWGGPVPTTTSRARESVAARLLELAPERLVCGDLARAAKADV